MPLSKKELFSVSHSLLYASEPDVESMFHLILYMYVMLLTLLSKN